MNTKRIKAIFIKEVQDIKTNTNVTIMFLIPILLTYLWENLMTTMPKGMGLSLGLMFLVVMVGMYVPSMLVAEEKEKKTMNVLLFSPATPMEILIGKGLLTFISILIVSILLLIISGAYSHLSVIITGVILTSIFSINIGIIVGLLSSNQMATGVIGTPIYLLLLLVPNFALLGIDIMEKIGKVLPTYYLINMMRLAIEDGKGLTAMYFDIGIISLSIIVSLVILIYVFRRRGIVN